MIDATESLSLCVGVSLCAFMFKGNMHESNAAMRIIFLIMVSALYDENYAYYIVVRVVFPLFTELRFFILESMFPFSWNHAFFVRKTTHPSVRIALLHPC